MFRQQLRAILRASALRQGAHPDADGGAPERGPADARGAGARARSSSTTPGRPYADVEVGAMIEVPAAALMPAAVPALLRLRLDRHQRPDPVHAGDRSRRRGGGASLRPVASGGAAADRADASRRRSAAGKDVSVCGEMAGDPAFTELLLAMGLRSFSMHPSQIAVDQAARPARRHAAAGCGAAARAGVGRSASASAARAAPRRDVIALAATSGAWRLPRARELCYSHGFAERSCRRRAQRSLSAAKRRKPSA